MTDLANEVRGCFERSRTMDVDASKGPVTFVKESELELAPGFNGMRVYYENQVLRILRRGYRHFAGSTRPTQADVLLEQTSPVMGPLLTRLLVEVFADGVRIGHREDYLVRMCFHYETVDTLFNDPDFREASELMADGFVVDSEVWEFFVEYVTGGLDHISHITGFAHSEVEPGKVWDLWSLLSTATLSASYLAGHLMGSSWRERDVLDRIEIDLDEGDGDGS